MQIITIYKYLLYANNYYIQIITIYNNNNNNKNR